MKRMDTYPPIQSIKEITQKVPSIWEHIAQAAARQRVEESLWRPDIYITSWRLEEEVLDRFYQVPAGTESKTAATLSVLSSWRRCKEVYRFAPDMEQMLYRQADCRLPISLLMHLPYSCFYIETPQLAGERYHGYFVSLDHTSIDQTGRKVRLLRLLACGRQDASDMRLIELPLEEGKMLIDEILPAAMRTANIAHISPEYATEFLMNYLYSMTGFITKLCQLILYITAQNADVIQQSQPGKERTGQAPPSGSGLAEIKDKYREIRGWDVGYRIVNKMKAVKREQSEQEQLTEGEESRNRCDNEMESELRHVRMSPVPHLRCGHWQTFWTGKREPDNPNRKRVLRWIAPAFINCGHDFTERLPVTINRFKAERKLAIRSAGEEERTL